MVMHGVKIGEVTGVTSLPGGGVRISGDLQKDSSTGLTDTMGIDFRPINYFGVTGINLVAGPGGQPLRNGMQLATVPRGNSTLQALLSRAGDISESALTPQLISVIDRTVRYTDALTPLIETMLIAMGTVADVQTVSTAKLLANSTGVAVAFPAFTNGFVGGGYNFSHTSAATVSDKDFQTTYKVYLDLLAGDFFNALGRLESKYIDDLLPTIDMTKLLTDTVPAVTRPDQFGQTLTEIRTRLEKLFAGTPEQRALQVHIVLDSLPGVAAPLGSMGAQP